ncbi:MAG: hydrogenase formation protein HypD [Bacillota bacterium]
MHKQTDFQSRDEVLAQTLMERVNRLGRRLAEEKGRKLKIMEVCGTHTVAYARSGITDLVSGYLDLRSGPGCPICVTHQQDLDRVFSLAGLEDTLIVTFGDLLRVPGSFTTLEKEKAGGGRVQICYSPLEAVETAARNPLAKVIFIAIGFETTAPAAAATILQAEARQLTNFWAYPVIKLVPPAISALLQKGNPTGLDGFLLPGHVSTVLGSNAFSFISKSGIPAVVAGFESLDLLMGLYTLLKFIAEKKAAVGNAYTHVVREEGNETARKLIGRCFEVEAETLWRGLGVIPESGYTLKPRYAEYNARQQFITDVAAAETDPLCICGEVITGRATPHECPLFSRRCTPSSPVGPCMVSPEGACGAYYHYM